MLENAYTLDASTEIEFTKLVLNIMRLFTKVKACEEEFIQFFEDVAKDYIDTLYPDPKDNQQMCQLFLEYAKKYGLNDNPDAE